MAALYELRKSIASGDSSFDAAAVDEFCASKMNQLAHRPQAFKETFSGLLECLPEADSPAFSSAGTSKMIEKAMSSLFGLAASQSGTQVKVRKGQLAEEGWPTYGVLVLGYGGSGLAELEAVDAVYASLQPSWQTVLTTQTALRGATIEKMVREQHAQVVEALSEVDHIFVHAMSNNGYGFWQKLAQRNPGIAAKVRGMIFDCGVVLGSDLGETEWFHIFSKTVIGVMVMADAVPSGGGMMKPAIQRIEAASRLLAKATARGGSEEGANEDDWSFDDLSAWQLEHESPVPTVCLTSKADLVVPEAGVRAYAKALQDAHVGRDVRVVSLGGTHCQQVITDRERYTEAISAHLERAQYVHMASAAGAEGLCAYGLTMRGKFLDNFEAKLRAQGEEPPSLPPSFKASTAAVRLELADLSDAAPAVVDVTPSTPEVRALGDSGWTELLERHELLAGCQGVLPVPLSTEDALDLLRSEGRPALLNKLKEVGVALLPARQKLANAVAKELRLRG